MARPAAEHPTELELRILKILWRESPLPVRDVRQRLADLGRDSAHTSVITTLNTMTRKRYLKRHKEGNAFLFSPRVQRGEVTRRMLGDLVDRVFDGSAQAVMLSLFDAAAVDADELKELRKVINQKLKDQPPA
jgi:BlaI family penicillinase repressor